MNGSTRHSLIDERRVAIDAVQATIAAVNVLRPHGRNYQTLPPGGSSQLLFDNAAWVSNMSALAGVMKSIKAEYWALVNHEI